MDHLPNLYLLGPPRSATTSVARWLGHHADIVMSRPKEPGYHCSDLAMRSRVADRADYLACFAAPEAHTYRGEATPWYLYSEEAAASIHAMEPHARLIIILRNPVDALASLHNHHVFTGWETEPDFMRAVFGPRPARSDDFRTDLDYLSVARLAPQLTRYLDRFPRDHLIIVDFDDIERSPKDVHLEFLKRLDVEPVPLDEYPRFNPARQVRSYAARRWSKRLPSGTKLRMVADRFNVVLGRPEPSPEVRRRLIAELDEDIAAVERLLDRDLGAWRRVER